MNVGELSTDYRAIVLFSGNGSNLQALIDGAQQYVVPCTFTDNPWAFGRERCVKAGIPCYIHVHKRKIVSTEQYFDALGRAVEYFTPDIVVLAGFMRIVTKSFLNRFEGKVINIHPSLLPKFKGLHTHRRVLEAGEKEHGVTIHWVTEELDGGPIIAQERFPIEKDDTEETLEEKVHKIEHVLYPSVVNSLARGDNIGHDINS